MLPDNLGTLAGQLVLCGFMEPGPSQAEDLEVTPPLSPQPVGPGAFYPTVSVIRTLLFFVAASWALVCPWSLCFLWG